MNQIEKAKRFAELHIPGNPLILYNVWDGGGARAVAAAGADAIASGSWSVAAAHGYEDGEAIPLDFVRNILARIVAATKLPVSVDFESGYAAEPEQVAENMAHLLEIGIVGINFEDGQPGRDGMYTVDKQVERIRAIRRCADEAGVPMFINARTDVFLRTPAERHHEQLAGAKERALAYADAGANGFFAPGLANEKMIADLCDASLLPVNIMIMDGMPSHLHLAELGVARLSYGPLPFVTLMRQLQENAQAAFSR